MDGPYRRRLLFEIEMLPLIVGSLLLLVRKSLVLYLKGVTAVIKTYYYDGVENRIWHDVDLRNKELLKNENCLLWVDVYNFLEEELNTVAEIFNFHYLTVEDCLHYSPRAKVDTYEGYYFFLLHAIRYQEDSDEEISMEQLNVYLGTNYVVTVHKRTLNTLGRVARQCLENNLEVMRKGPDYFLYSILDGFIDSYFPILDRIDVRVDELEDEIYEQPDKEITDEFLALKRTILSIRRAIIPQKKMFAGLINNGGGKALPYVREDNEPYFLDLVDHIERIIDSVDEFEALVDGVIATYHSIVATRTNVTMRVLTVISTIFMPITAITGFFGMNVPLPYQEFYWSTVVIAVGLIGLSLWMFVIFRSNRWI